MRRFTRLTNGFSKKIDNHIHMVSLYFLHYNFCRIHKTQKVTPAMAAGVSETLHYLEWIVGLIDARASETTKRGPYKKNNSNWDTTIKTSDRLKNKLGRWKSPQIFSVWQGLAGSGCMDCGGSGFAHPPKAACISVALGLHHARLLHTRVLR